MLSYNKYKLYGNSLTDYIWVHDVVDSQTTIDSTTGYTYAPQWDSKTVFLAPFTENINGGEGTVSTGNVINWLIYRQDGTNQTLNYIGSVPASQSNLIDYGILNNAQYKYIIYGETDSALTTPISQQDIQQTSWWNWSLVGLIETDKDNQFYGDTNNIWLFDSNLTSNALEQNVDKTIMNNFTQFPKVSTGQMNYLTTGITALLSNVDKTTGKYTDSVDLYNKFNAFIADSSLKLLRDRKGNGWIVSTDKCSANYNDVTSEQMITVNFTVTQLDTLSGNSVIGG